jgi:hypothetical protein
MAVAVIGREDNRVVASVKALMGSKCFQPGEWSRQKRAAFGSSSAKTTSKRSNSAQNRRPLFHHFRSIFRLKP